nr:hypothetical protein [Tanacetum cinerariifolium]
MSLERENKGEIWLPDLREKEKQQEATPFTLCGKGYLYKGACEETKRDNANCTLENNFQRASTLGTQSDKAPVHDSDGSAEYIELLEPVPEPHQVPQNDSNVISEVSSVEQAGETIKQHSANVEETCAYHESLFHNLASEVEKVNSEATKFVEDFKSLAKEADDSLAKHKALELEIEGLLKAVKLENENMALEFQAQTKTIIHSLQDKLHDMIYENEKLRAQLFDKVSKQKDTSHGTSTNTKFAKQPILGKPPSSFRPKLYAVTPFTKSKAIPKIDESHALSKLDISNSVPTPQNQKL